MSKKQFKSTFKALLSKNKRLNVYKHIKFLLYQNNIKTHKFFTLYPEFYADFQNHT